MGNRGLIRGGKTVQGWELSGEEGTLRKGTGGQRDTARVPAGAQLYFRQWPLSCPPKSLSGACRSNTGSLRPGGGSQSCSACYFCFTLFCMCLEWAVVSYNT